jgi:hypothetical protein
MDVRVQGPDGPTLVNVGKGATLADLRAAIASACNIPPAEQVLLSGFPPVPMPAAGVNDSADAEQLLGGGGGARVLVRRAQSSSSSSAPSAGAGRRKPQQVRRLQEAPPPQPAPVAALAASSAGAPGEEEEARAQGNGVEEGANPPAPPPASKKRKQGPTLQPNADPLALTLASEAARQKGSSGGGGSGGGGSSSGTGAPTVRRMAIDKIAREYYASSGRSIEAAVSAAPLGGDASHSVVDCVYRRGALSGQERRPYDRLPLGAWHGRAQGQRPRQWQVRLTSTLDPAALHVAGCAGRVPCDLATISLCSSGMSTL